MTYTLAHQGGWDEMLIVASVVIGFVGMLLAARRRDEPAESGDETAP